MQDIIRDGGGRDIALRSVGVMEQLRLFKILGPELSINAAYMQAACVGAAVAMIDGIPIPFPDNRNALEALLERIGLKTMALIAEAINDETDEKLVSQAGN